MPSNPRVVVLTTYFRPIIGGVESTAERLSRFLVRTGFSAHVVTKRVVREWPDHDRLDGMTIERIGPYGERGPSGKWRMIPAATNWLVRHASDYDVVCCIDYRGLGTAALAARSMTKRPVIFQAQTTGVLSGSNADAALGRAGIAPDTWLGRLVKSGVTSIYRRADSFACISHDIERETVAAGVPASRVHFLPNPVDMQRFRPAQADERAAGRAALGLGRERLVCLYIGRLSREKGMMDLLEAWRLLNLRTPRAATESDPLLVVGGPDMPGNAWDVGPEGREFVERHGLGATVRFLGPIDDVASLLQIGDLAVVPSHFEALGLSALEALACGVPVIASSVDGLLDFMKDGVNGALCPPRDPARLADILSALLGDADRRRGLAANARESVVRAYDEQAVFSRFGDVIRTLAERRA